MNDVELRMFCVEQALRVCNSPCFLSYAERIYEWVTKGKDGLRENGEADQPDKDFFRKDTEDIATGSLYQGTCQSSEG